MEDQDNAHQIERLIAENERLRQENNLKNAWISLISHNFKGAFSNLISLIEALEQGSVSKGDFFNLLPEIKLDATNNLQLITDTAAWSKTQREGYKPEPKEWDVVEIYAKLKEAFQEKLANKQLQFIYQGTETIKIYADHDLISFVLERIIDNAIKYSHHGRSIFVTAEETSEESVILIADQGTGMNENQLKSIFTFDSPVYRGTEGETGVGLSLKIVQNFVYLMDGRIEIDSSVNTGTTVKIILPRN